MGSLVTVEHPALQLGGFRFGAPLVAALPGRGGGLRSVGLILAHVCQDARRRGL